MATKPAELTPEIFRAAIKHITECVAKMPPMYDGFEDDGEVIWLLKDGKVLGCAHRQQFYEIRNGSDRS